MFLPNDITARLKMLRHRRARGFGSFRNKILVHWTSILTLALILLLLVSSHALYTFLYWYNLEDHISSSGETAYDEEKVQTIFDEFSKKSTETELLLESAPAPRVKQVPARIEQGGIPVLE